MHHARADYQRIQDPEGLIPDEEPVFLIRGQDGVGWRTVVHWALDANQFGASDEIVARALEHAAAMLRWPKGKIPDLPGRIDE